jgi:cell division septation protein DedD
MATPSVSLVESLIGAIPLEEGAALVARVGERATITARSGSIEVGSVALTVEAMDDLIAQVLPPDQLESLQENGTVHFEFKPQVIGGDFAVLAASTPGDRWLEIRRRTTATGTSTAGAQATTTGATATQATATPATVAPATPAPTTAAPTTAAATSARPAAPAASAAPTAAVPTFAAVIPVPTQDPVPAAAAIPVSDDADVAQLLSRFQISDAAATPGAQAQPAAPERSLFPSTPASTPASAADFDLDLPAKVPAREPSLEPVKAVAQPESTNDDLSIPASLDFPAAASDFNLDDLSLPDTLPAPIIEAFEPKAPGEDFADADHIQIGESKASSMAKSRLSTSSAAGQPRRSIVVLLSVSLGVVVLAAGGWFAAEHFLSAPSVAVAPPPPAPRKPIQQNTAAASTPVNPPSKTAAAPSRTTVAQTPHVDATAPKSGPSPVVARANAETAAPKPRVASSAAPVVAPIATRGPAAPAPVTAPAPPGSHDGFSIQVAAVLERSEADRIVARLVNEGYSGYAIRGQGSAANYFRVRVGAFKDRQAAEEVAARLQRSEGVKPWIVKETP